MFLKHVRSICFFINAIKKNVSHILRNTCHYFRGYVVGTLTTHFVENLCLYFFPKYKESNLIKSWRFLQNPYKRKLFYTGKKKRLILKHLIIKVLGRVTSNIIIQCDNLHWQKLMLAWFCNQKLNCGKNLQRPNTPSSFFHLLR